LKLAVAALLAATACSSKRPPPPGDDPAAVHALADRAVIKQGPIGAGQATPGTYVLVDVENPSPTDRLVTLGGSLLDGENRPVSRLLPDELRIPTRGTRTFALVADAPALTATHASFKVENAVTVDYDPPVILEDPQVKLGDLAVIAAKVKNTVDKECTAVVAATFYGKDGAILTRPFTIVPLPGSASRPVRFEGPKETARAEVFVGQVAFHP